MGQISVLHLGRAARRFRPWRADIRADDLGVGSRVDYCRSLLPCRMSAESPTHRPQTYLIAQTREVATYLWASSPRRSRLIHSPSTTFLSIFVILDICQKWLGGWNHFGSPPEHCSRIGATLPFLPDCDSIQRCDPHPAKALPLEGRRKFGISPNSVDRRPSKLRTNPFRRAVFALFAGVEGLVSGGARRMEHSDAVLAFVFLVASVIWLIRLSDTDRRR